MVNDVQFRDLNIQLKTPRQWYFYQTGDGVTFYVSLIPILSQAGV